MNVVPFDPQHLRDMTPQAAQRVEFTPEAMAADYGQAWTGMVDGKPVACAGLVEMWAGRAYAWAVLSKDVGPHLLRVTREIRFRLDAAPFGRVEMAVDAKFSNGCRWAERLGFRLESLAGKYLPGGRDAFIYVRI